MPGTIIWQVLDWTIIWDMIFLWDKKVLSQILNITKKYIPMEGDRKSTRLNSSHVRISYAVFCLKKKKMDGSYHEVDSSEMAFKIAGSMALKNALGQAGSQNLEPVMTVEVKTPDEFPGYVIGATS